MGIPPGDCRRAGELFGMKTFLNEFIAYKKLGELLQIYENNCSYVLEHQVMYLYFIQLCRRLYQQQKYI